MGELAALTGNAPDLVSVHVDDQMDAKSLLGAYVCTSVPGEFLWQPGPLTQVRPQAPAPVLGGMRCSLPTVPQAPTAPSFIC